MSSRIPAIILSTTRDHTGIFNCFVALLKLNEEKNFSNSLRHTCGLDFGIDCNIPEWREGRNRLFPPKVSVSAQGNKSIFASSMTKTILGKFFSSFHLSTSTQEL